MKTSHDELYALCEAHDIVILQETWLAKNELSLLSNTVTHCDVLMFVMLIPYVFQRRCCCQTTRVLLSVLVIQLHHGLIISCPPPQDIPYYRMSMLREITFLQITCHSVSMLLLIMQLIVCMILVVTIIAIICPSLTEMAPQIVIYTGTVCPPRVSYPSLVYHSIH